MIYSIKKKAFSLDFELTEDGLSIVGGSFGRLKVEPSPLFELVIGRLGAPNRADREKKLYSGSRWESVKVMQSDDWMRISFHNPANCGDITLVYTALIDECGISWSAEVINDSFDYTVYEVGYPTIKVAAEPLNLFIPEHCGRYIKNAARVKWGGEAAYPSTSGAMQYYCFDSEGDGLYLGVHDPRASMKKFTYALGEGTGLLKTNFHAINAGRVANSFELAGKMRWQAFKGDWYDAAMLYADFVHNNADWLPPLGRPDTDEKYKEIAFWVADYIPNSPAQRDAKPMILGAVSDKYDKNYWFEAPIEIKKRLGVPVAYHVYNWHEIPFNINYPHYTPAREEYFRGLDALKDAGVYVMPYINAVSWEEHDKDEGFELNFKEVGYKGATVTEEGEYARYPYPQKKLDGATTKLMPICPTFPVWHKQIERETREIERTMRVDGVYFDEVAAHRAHPCRSKEHAHLPGGGSYWSEGYNLMMSKIRHNKPNEAFYFTENNAEPYMKSFDGYLTWMWWCGEGVPAYPAVYAGYVQLLGRYTDGVNRDDDLFFRYHIAGALMYGQQLGWINANVVYNEGRMSFLEPVAKLRYEYTELFNCGKLLRPPMTECDLAPVTSSKITMDMTAAGAWQYRDGSETVIFVSNIAEQPCECKLGFDFAEYGLSAEKLPEGFTVDGTLASATLSLEPCEVRAISIK